MAGIQITNIAKDFIINIFNLVILFLIVRSLVYKPVRKFLTARTEKIEETRRQTEENLSRAKEAETKYINMVEEGKLQQIEMINEAERTAKESSRHILENAKQNARDLLDRTRKDMQAEHSAMVAAMNAEITELAVDISRRILRRELNDSDNLKIAAEFFSEDNANAKSMLEESAERVRRDLQEEFDVEKFDVASLALDISKKILSHSVTDQDNLKIAEQFFNEKDQ